MLFLFRAEPKKSEVYWLRRSTRFDRLSLVVRGNTLPAWKQWFINSNADEMNAMMECTLAFTAPAPQEVEQKACSKSLKRCIPRYQRASRLSYSFAWQELHMNPTEALGSCGAISYIEIPIHPSAIPDLRARMEPWNLWSYQLAINPLLLSALPRALLPQNPLSASSPLAHYSLFLRPPLDMEWQFNYVIPWNWIIKISTCFKKGLTLSLSSPP